ncbi:alkaline phosphatase D family protein [Plantactinospora sp. KLBMP9567]|uniref:alkaline phosphatase D family protein n=1 Tax=Plantactinospora sp. KLBMP9567 TaxID=3085900 RepID=UPI0029819856|nr:alkaline phosphatase D family protein [Plantactinospora sp. KLBMP9567]MDW5330143.1 alkaline phosphatase D family protein [Plantactinospora sp. KLBMP9567]
MNVFPISRRRFLTVAGGAATVVAVSQLVAELPEAYAAELDAAPFTLGVASGEPRHDSVVLWTRLAPDPLDAVDGGMPAEPVRVRWEVARDPGFRHLVRTGEVTALPESAHAVHVVVPHLSPDRWYWYRFRVGEATSRVGRTRTLPAPGAKVDHLRFAFASCQSWAGGPYPAYRDMAEQELDFVVHLGDYIYETTDGSLTEFRRLHALYKTSPDLRAAHARFPFILTWDDHEVQNNYAGPVAGAAGDGRPFLERRANGYQAYHEHLPLRPEQRPDGPDMLLYRRFDFGRLARFSVLDTRQYRSDQALGDGRKEPTGEVFDPTRTMTGPEQERWLLDGLRRSKARWNVIAQQTIMAAFDYDLGPGRIVNLDQWDGYPPARSRILDFVARHRISNPVVLSGDWHTHWVNDLKSDFADARSRTVATEFVGTSISSGAGWDADVRAGLAANPHVRFYNGSYRGYVICDVTERRWRADLRIVLDARDPASPAYTIAAFEVRDGVPGARRIDAGDGIVGRVADQVTGDPLPNVEVAVFRADGSRLVASTTDPSGEVLAFAPPGDYTVSVNGVGYEPLTRQVAVRAGTPSRLDLRLTRAATRAGTGRTVPGPQSSAGVTDPVLGNDLVALAVSAGTDDPQLAGVTVGKPLDFAAVGHLDQLDWINLPYASAAQPRGGNAWQQRTVRSTAVEVLDGPVAAVRATGVSTAVPDIAVVTTYSIRPGEPWVAVESVFRNGGSVARTFWIGDALDHDGAGQRSGVPGHGTITSGTPADYPPAAPWIGMTGSDRQTYGLCYEETGFVAYAAYNWVMSQRQVTLEPGATFTLRRRIVALDNGGAADPFAVLERV